MSIQTCVPDVVWQAMMAEYGTDVFKVALYTDAANLGPTTTVYTTSGEYVGSGYTAGGFALTNVPPFSWEQYIMAKWQDCDLGVDMPVRGAMIYNTSKSNRATVILDFGSSSAKRYVRFDTNGVLGVRKT